MATSPIFRPSYLNSGYHRRISSLRNIIPFKHQVPRRERFENLLRPHFETLYAAARRMTLSATDAQDLVQEVFLKAFERFDDFENIEYKRAWLLKVMYHKFIDSRRDRDRSPIDLAESGAESLEPDSVGQTSSQPDELVDREMRVDQVLKAMGYLRKEHCMLLALHDVEGLTIDELHQLTGKPVGTIKAQLHRTRIKLGRLLSNDAVTKPRLRIVGGKS